MKRTPFIVVFNEISFSYFGGNGYLSGTNFGFGCETPEQREAETTRILESSLKEGRFYLAEWKEGCERCRVTGVEPGFKRKKCVECGGVGVLNYQSRLS